VSDRLPAVVFTIRRADLADAAGIAAVQVASWRTTYPGIVAQEYIDRLSVDTRSAAWESVFRDEAREPPDVVVATDSNGEIVGFASGGKIREPQPGFDAELYAIYLVKAVQRRGVGRRLLSEWATLAVANNLRSAVVRVLAANPARRFYEHLGARLIKDGSLTIDGQPYPEEWYGWDDLRALRA
jgi:ribosomal protein S18 acetylase RimI-like enzyme